MTTQSSKIWVDDVEDYLFCPRKLYLAKTLEANHPEPTRVRKGKKKHKIRSDWISRKGGMESILIKNKKLGITGKVDGIIKQEDAIEVYEIKDTARKQLYESEILQGTLYSELVKREWNKPTRLIFRLRGKDKEVEVTKEIRKKALESIEKARKIIEGKIVPMGTESEKCSRCPLRNACK